MTEQDNGREALEATREEVKSSGSPQYIVGIGASAGGMEALVQFFENMPVDTGIAFVVIQHLSPHFKSLLDELLGRKTQIPIQRAEDGMQVRANTIYIIPPGKDIVIANGRLQLADRDPMQAVPYPIDHFLRSLANDVGDKAIAVILSGTGSDGSRGVCHVHEAGGLVIVQTPETAKFDGMPNSARRTGAVDLLLPPQEMPEAILEYIRHQGQDGTKADSIVPAESEEGLEAVFRMLREVYGIDFSQYRMTTVRRRIERRLLLNRGLTIKEYIERLRQDPEELDALYKDLLIGVTRFFRDPKAFEKLEQEVIPKLIRELRPDEEFRAWVAGCATGEEAYSVAILVHEAFTRARKPVRAKIFATDVHRASLDYASAGWYTEAQVMDVSPERLQRYFRRRGSGYQVLQELRQMVVFAAHDITKDAPFTKLDLISCRNLLIYFEPPLQKKVISLFHFALKPNGYLFLGPSESPGELGDEFITVDTYWKIYKKRRDLRLPAELPLSVSQTPRTSKPVTRPGVLPVPRQSDSGLLPAYDVLLEEFMPPSLLINETNELIQILGGGEKYVRLKSGRVTTNVLEMVSPELRIILGGAIPRVFNDKTPVRYRSLRISLPDGEHLVDLTIRPIETKRGGEFYALIVFHEHGKAQQPQTAQDLSADEASQDHVNALEAELRFTKENLQATIEELETSNEELQATNEELLAANEELQSANEELHSVNEELYSVNTEYQKKIAELTQLTRDMDHLLESTQVHTLFLDRELRIRKFTPHIAEAFHLVPEDVGRRIDVFTHNIDHPTLIDDLKTVMETREPIERQVRDHQGNWFLLRVLPYRRDEIVDGCVLTLVDITSLKRAEREAQEAVRQRDRFLAILSHELRNPLGAIVNAVETMSRAEPDDDAYRAALDVLRRQSTQMSRLLDDLLDISRVAQGKVQLTLQAVRLNELVQEAATVARPNFERKGVALEVDCGSEPILIVADAARIQQVVVNLLMNALKFTPQGGRVAVTVQPDDAEAVIRVRDTGSGIAPEHLARVFEPFFQADPEDVRVRDGLGIGLTLVKTLVELHGGRVEANSEGEGRGSEFVVRLPIASDKKEDGDQRPPQVARPLRIVIVEDNDDSREMLASLLRLHGQEVVASASDGEAGLDAILKERPDLAIIDIGLPKMDGCDLARRIRATLADASPYLVALTGFGQESDHKLIMEAGYDEHIVKPVRPGDITRLLRQAAKKAGLVIDRETQAESRSGGERDLTETRG